MVIALCEYMVQLPISALATPIFPTKFATVKALRSSMRQCSSYSGHTHLQLLNRVIHSNTEVECLTRVWLCLENLEPAPIWFALKHSQKSGGLHLWARRNEIQQENIREYPKIREIREHFLSWTIPIIRYLVYAKWNITCSLNFRTKIFAYKNLEPYSICIKLCIATPTNLIDITNHLSWMHSYVPTTHH